MGHFSRAFRQFQYIRITHSINKHSQATYSYSQSSDTGYAGKNSNENRVAQVGFTLRRLHVPLISSFGLVRSLFKCH